MQLNFLGGIGKTTKILLTGGHHACILNLLISDGNQSTNDVSLGFIPTQPHGTVLNSPTSYSGSHGFKPQSGERPIWRAAFIAFFSNLGNFTTTSFRIVSLKRNMKSLYGTGR